MTIVFLDGFLVFRTIVFLDGLLKKKVKIIGGGVHKYSLMKREK
jgi:hypothetical protein